MTQAICFECKKKLLRVSEPMEDLINDDFPVFCSYECANSFPFRWDVEYQERLTELRRVIEQ